ncbi:hypothetical protein EXM65_00035 [Clostridium botulinum]|uniref:Uncharacterized protein n=1 Tax=Clostridium botulinum TaxID=1491 RepID=A0A6M0SIM8_CLOBO|nr:MULTISPECIES: hypothetical protein [Clostridium]MCS6132648.1 hypothetical protein [Clostridium botulinum]NFA40992.1 hypothetical protein [Clostridium botulinum]NFL46334.1 hypothetical protein [Clostridium botulinum]NFL91220.1 hypothetical protein [Clostridium botulinum]
MQLECKKCKSEIPITNEMIKRKYLGAMYDEIYYKCPVCNKKYIVAIENTKARKLKKQGNKKEYKNLLDKINGK